MAARTAGATEGPTRATATPNATQTAAMDCLAAQLRSHPTDAIAMQPREAAAAPRDWHGYGL
eukprot:7207055-Lingulodinium_polyedra.AAC.1